MGNCLGFPRAPSWTDEGRDAGSSREHYCAKKRALSAAKGGGPKTTEVKIRITKKHLEELLRQVDHQKKCGGGGVPVQQVIAELLGMQGDSSSNHKHQERHWKPALQSIPEVAEG